MGLAEKKAINEVMEKDVPRYQEYMTKEGVTLSLKADWETFPEGTAAIETARSIMGDVSTAFWGLGQNKIAQEEIAKQLESFLIRHDASITDEYDYKLKKDGKQMVMTANLLIFVFSSSPKQKGLKSSIESLL